MGISTVGILSLSTISGEKTSKVQFFLQYHFRPDHPPPTITTTQVTYGKQSRTCCTCAWPWSVEREGLGGGGGPSEAITLGRIHYKPWRHSECLWHQSVDARQSWRDQWPATDVYYSATLITVRLIVLLEHKNSFRKYKNLKHCPHVFYKTKQTFLH